GLGDGGQKSGPKMQVDDGESVGDGIREGDAFLSGAAALAPGSARAALVPPITAVTEMRQAAAAIAARRRLPRRAAGSLMGATGSCSIR
ncbi:MAG TPA: hypothetical protein VGR61_11505, partial [Candidatus Dormibacteraeota bacterium]|nr:hypothetical protein [Candidatus Dormibacteraeota bacterium]